jgi:hypothetical protein
MDRLHNFETSEIRTFLLIFIWLVKNGEHGLLLRWPKIILLNKGTGHLSNTLKQTILK